MALEVRIYLSLETADRPPIIGQLGITYHARGGARYAGDGQEVTEVRDIRQHPSQSFDESPGHLVLSAPPYAELPRSATGPEPKPQ